MELQRRIAAYGVCRDHQQRVLLVHGSARRPDTWVLPGGGVAHGEHPADTVVRKLAEQTGLVVQIAGLHDVAAEVVAQAPALEHTDAVIYELVVVGGQLRAELAEGCEATGWRTAAQVARAPLSRFAAQALGLRLPPAPPLPAGVGQVPPVARGALRGQRFGVYGLVTDPAGRLLLTLIADGYPGAGRWHLPGGGTDFAEQPAMGLQREITEESGQVSQIGQLLTVANQHRPRALGPEGYPVDWHSVRAVFQVEVLEPTRASVCDLGGSTAAARWLTRAEAKNLPLTDIAGSMLREYG